MIVFCFQRYWTEEAEAPFRCRLQRSGLKFSRDIAKWEKRLPKKKTAGSSEQGDNGSCADHQNGRKGAGGDGGGGGGGSGGDGAGFFAFPLVVHNSHAHHVVRK